MELTYPLTIDDNWKDDEKELTKSAYILHKMREMLPEHDIEFSCKNFEPHIFRFWSNHKVYGSYSGDSIGRVEISWKLDTGRSDCLWGLPGCRKRKIANNFEELLEFLKMEA